MKFDDEENTEVARELEQYAHGPMQEYKLEE